MGGRNGSRSKILRGRGSRGLGRYLRCRGVLRRLRGGYDRLCCCRRGWSRRLGRFGSDLKDSRRDRDRGKTVVL